MKKRVLLVEQHLRRGVDANAHIAAHLENFGVKTRLSLTGAQLCTHLLRFEPHVVYYPWVTPYVYNFLRRREQEVSIVNAFQEQNTVLHQPDAPMVQWTGKGDYIFAWGQAHKQRFEELFSELSVVLTGNPRFDPYFDSSIAEALYPSRRELAERHGLPLDKNWVLVALDFPLIFSSENRLEELIERGDLSQGRVDVTRKVYRLLKGWMQRFVAEKGRETVLIMRPHPGSNLNQIEQDFGGETETVCYIKGGGLPPWILAANRYVTRASTSVMEAWLADTPTALIHREMHIDGGNVRPHILEAETSLDSYSEFCDFINSRRREGSRDRHHNFLASHYRLDGRSAWRTAQKLQEIASQQEGEPRYRGGTAENVAEHAKFAVKKFLNESGLNRWNPFERPNGEFLSQRRAQRKVDSITVDLDLNGQNEAVR
jgi:surface carbohydrate biosynthesis protein